MTVPGAVGIDLFLDVGKQIGGILHLIEDYRRRVQFQETRRHTHGSNTFQPAFLIQIEGRALSTDIIGEIITFVFEDNEEELGVMELSVTNRNLCGDDALDLDLVFQVTRLGKIKCQLHAKPCFGCRAERL